MKILNERTVKGRRRVYVELNAGEDIVPVVSEAQYKLPMTEEIVPGFVLTDAVQVYWCWMEQKWKEGA